MKIAIRRLSTLALLLAVASCTSDHTTAPATLSAPSAGASNDLLGGLLGTVTNTLGLTVNGLQRRTPLAAPITVTKTIGWEGGYLSIPEAGVSVVVPTGALSSPTQITMTARAGSLVAYDFAPHGITFAKPLVFTQDVRMTNAGLLSTLKLGYYSDPSLLGSTTAVVSELINGVLSWLTGTFTAPIRHFSGYVVLCGRSDTGE
ncbi:MAG: hypothetical protein ACJ8AD_13580 [Gemmatimonadaceae bacterium]